MAETRAKLASVDPVWGRIVKEADEAVAKEPLLGGMIHYSVLHHPSLERALSYRISLKLANGEMTEQILREICDEAYAADPSLAMAARADIMAVYERDPACHRFLQPLLFFKGFQAIQCYRVGNWLWRQGRTDLAYFVQMRCSEAFGVDIHPAAKIGQGIMIDHAHSIVIGDGCGGRQRVDAAFRDTRGDRQGRGRSSSEDRRWCADRGRCQSAGQYQSW